MSEIHWQSIWERAVRESSYAPEAFEFIRDGLSHTVDLIHGDGAGQSYANADDLVDSSRHVTGRQLCMGLRDYAIRRYGLLTRVVLRTWGVHTTEDFGHLVFGLVDAGLMRKTDEDSIEDFQGVFDFAEEFPLPTEDDPAPAIVAARTPPTPPATTPEAAPAPSAPNA